MHMNALSNELEGLITKMSAEAKVKWIRKVRQLTNEKILNVPKALDFLEAGDKVAICFDGHRVLICKQEGLE